MTKKEILQAVGLWRIWGMTVNEQLFISGLMDEFDKSKIHDKNKAAYILVLLQVDKLSIAKLCTEGTIKQIFTKIFMKIQRW